MVDAGEPPRQCDSHINDPAPPPCGRCAESRKAHEAWTAAQQVIATESRASIRAAINACQLCDENGLTEVRANAATKCDHRDAANA